MPGAPGRDEQHRGLGAPPEKPHCQGWSLAAVPGNSLPCLCSTSFSPRHPPAVPLEHSPFPKPSRPAGTGPAQAPSLQTALEPELPFPLIHPIVFLHFLPHKTPLVHPSGYIHCRHRAAFGREINSRVPLWAVICAGNKAVPSSGHISRLALVALGWPGRAGSGWGWGRSCILPFAELLPQAELVLSNPKCKQTPAAAAQSRQKCPRAAWALCCQHGQGAQLAVQIHSCFP